MRARGPTTMAPRAHHRSSTQRSATQHGARMGGYGRTPRTNIDYTYQHRAYVCKTLAVSPYDARRITRITQYCSARARKYSQRCSTGARRGWVLEKKAATAAASAVPSGAISPLPSLRSCCDSTSLPRPGKASGSTKLTLGETVRDVPPAEPSAFAHSRQ